MDLSPQQYIFARMKPLGITLVSWHGGPTYLSSSTHAVSDLGLSSIGATLAICLTDGLKSQRLPLKPNGLDFLIEAGQRVDETDLASMLDLSSRELPEKNAAMRSIQGMKSVESVATVLCPKADDISSIFH